MNEQPEALRLADELAIQNQYDFYKVCEEAAAELRWLHEENERLREALHDISISQNSMYQEARAKQALGEDQNIWRMCGLNTDDVIKMADEAGIVMSLTDERVTLNKLNRFSELHLKALRNDGYRKCAEGQRTTQYCGLLDAAVKAEREACAAACEARKIIDPEYEYDRHYNQGAEHCAFAIRARGEQEQPR
jgi:hypothetical protein